MKLYSKLVFITSLCLYLTGISQANPSAPKVINQKVLNCLRPLGYHLYYKEFSCSLGGEKFHNLSLGTHSVFARYLDFKPVSYIGFPAPLPVCPSNGFVMYKRKFTTVELEALKKIINSDEYQRLYAQKHASYYLVAIIKEKLKQQSRNHWALLLYASWEAHECQHTDKYKYYVLETIKAAKKVATPLKPEQDEYWQINILISNLYRRIGDFQSAQSWLQGLRAKPSGKNGEYFSLALRLLHQAIIAKSTKAVPIK